VEREGVLIRDADVFRADPIVTDPARLKEIEAAVRSYANVGNDGFDEL